VCIARRAPRKLTSANAARLRRRRCVGLFASADARAPMRVRRSCLHHCATTVASLTLCGMTTTAHPPETVEGWFLAHQAFRADRAALRGLGDESVRAYLGRADAALESIAEPSEGGWSIAVALAGSASDLLVVHARTTLEELHAAQHTLAATPLFDLMRIEYSFLSVTEAGLYHITAELAREAAARGGSVGDDEYRSAAATRAAAERGSAHVRRRLYPPLPDEMRYVCFYPMSKRRDPGANWYQLSLDERSRLMHTHGLTGRRYAGRVQQVISGAIGLDEWEWGVTLFGKDPLEFKKLVTDMRFDEVSALYATFGRFFVGYRSTITDALAEREPERG
jgi:chlorite dismutase